MSTYQFLRKICKKVSFMGVALGVSVPVFGSPLFKDLLVVEGNKITQKANIKKDSNVQNLTKYEYRFYENAAWDNGGVIASPLFPYYVDHQLSGNTSNGTFILNLSVATNLWSNFYLNHKDLEIKNVSASIVMTNNPANDYDVVNVSMKNVSSSWEVGRTNKPAHLKVGKIKDAKFTFTKSICYQIYNTQKIVDTAKMYLKIKANYSFYENLFKEFNEFLTEASGDPSFLRRCKTSGYTAPGCAEYQAYNLEMKKLTGYDSGFDRLVLPTMEQIDVFFKKSGCDLN
ncbi:MAG: hypothetical protein QE271_08970 [Bacteriovoracaceae bacterium]|nr:hypothetical protein [Bacteriovoracaceae bacterium]